MRALSERIDALATDADDLAPYSDDGAEEDEPAWIDSDVEDDEVIVAAQPNPRSEARSARGSRTQDGAASSQLAARSGRGRTFVTSGRRATSPARSSTERADDVAQPPVASIGPSETAESSATRYRAPRRTDKPTVSPAAAVAPTAASDASRHRTTPVDPPQPATKRTGRIVPIIALLALIAAAFVAGSWWAGRDGTTNPGGRPR